MVLAVVVQIGRVGWAALPFWIASYRPEKQCPKGTFRTRHELAVEALKLVRTWFSGTISLLADGAYNNCSLVGPARELQIIVTTRIRSDASLREVEPGPQPKSKRGAKPKHGPWLPSLSTLARQTRKFTAETVAIYRKTARLELRELVAYWPALDCVVGGGGDHAGAEAPEANRVPHDDRPRPDRRGGRGTIRASVDDRAARCSESTR